MLSALIPMIDMKVGTRVMVQDLQLPNATSFDYGSYYAGQKGVTIVTNHNNTAVGASDVKLDSGVVKAFWHFHLKKLNVGRNAL